MTPTQRRLTIKIIVTVLMAIFSITMLIPFAWMLSASFKFENQIFQVPIEWIPSTPTLENYALVWLDRVPFHLFYLNSIKVTLISVIGDVATCSLAAYAFSKIKFRGRNFFFWMYVATLVFPNQMMLIPRFLLFRLTGIYDTHWTLILPGIFSAFGTFMLRQFFDTIPQEMSESAKIDGAGHFTIFSKIIVPLATASFAALIIFQFVSSWNEYEGPLIYLRNHLLFTIPVGLNYFRDENATRNGAIMAASVCSLIPIFIVFLTFQKQFVAGIATSGMKE